jgi:hypothetical protein
MLALHRPVEIAGLFSLSDGCADAWTERELSTAGNPCEAIRGTAVLVAAALSGHAGGGAGIGAIIGA